MIYEWWVVVVGIVHFESVECDSGDPIRMTAAALAPVAAAVAVVRWEVVAAAVFAVEPADEVVEACVVGMARIVVEVTVEQEPHWPVSCILAGLVRRQSRSEEAAGV